MTKSRQVADFGAGGFYAGKNKIINGDFGIWQRGTSFTSLSNAIAYTADRWFQFVGATVTQSEVARSTDVPTGFTYSLKYGRPNGETDHNLQYLAQILESAASLPLAGKSITLSFYAKKGANYSAASDALIVKLSSGTGTDQSAATFSGGPATGFTGNTLVIDSSATLTTSWQRFTFTGSVASTATQIGLAIGFDPVGTAGADDNFYITGVQLEVGTVATPFQTASGTLQGELALCQRYYYLVVTNDSRGLIGGGQYNGATVVDALVPFPTTMRTEPTLVSTSGTNYYIFRANATDDSFDSVTIMGEVTTNNGGVYTTSGVSGTSGHAGNLYTGNTAASVAFSAEL